MGGRRRVTGPTRRARRTVRIVCEGYAEVTVIQHLKTLYTGRLEGHSVSLRNARGGGGQHALSLALSRRVRAGVDQMAVFVDADSHWDDGQRVAARRGGVVVVESMPCLEAWLLQVADRAAPPDSARCKRAFRDAFGGDAHDPDVYARHFDRTLIDGARGRVAVLDQLLRVLGV